MRTQRMLCLALAAALMAAGAFLAVLPQGLVAADLGTGIGDKPAHGVIGAIVTSLLLYGQGGFQPLRAACVLLLIAGLSGALEIVQPLAGRAGELSDWLAGDLGALLAIGAACLAGFSRSARPTAGP